jgi:signal transduction histidine kinase
MLRIREKLLVAYLLLAAAILVAFGWLSYGSMRKTLELELGKRLVSIAQAAAAQIDGSLVDGLRRAFAEEGDLVRRSRTYEYLRLRLFRLRETTGVRGISVFGRDLGNLVEDTGEVPVGERAYAREADRAELEQVFAGQGRASILFTGQDGVVYKSGYAPLWQGAKVVAALAVDGPAEFFTVLADLRSSLLVVAGALVLVGAAISLLLALRFTRPLRALVDAAQAIGRGDLSQEIRVQTRDEVGFLARTMEEMRGQIQARERQMQMMLAGIAHEVRNPLGGIELYAGLLREDLSGDARKLARVQKIERELSHLKSVVIDFLDFTRRVPLEKAPIDLATYLEEAVALVASEAEGGPVRTEVRVSPEASRVVADPDKLRRVLLNLLRNSLQAMPEGGTLSVSTAREGGFVLLTVRDTGVGMSEEVQREVFTPFFTTRERGTGLGLAFVKKIIEEHGGTVQLRSAPGEGTSVTLCLPEEGPGEGR